MIRFINIGEIWEEKNKHGIPNTRIYKEFIEPVYGIGISTFYKALTIPAKKLLAMMGDENVLRTDEKNNQLE